MEHDFKKDVSIDRFKLEEECEKQSSIYLYWSEQLAEAKANWDQICTKLKLLKAEKQLHYRNNPLKDHKVTVDSIQAMVDQDDEIVKAREERTEAQKKVDILFGVVHSLEHKRSQLQNLRELWIAGYYSQPGRSRSSADDVASEERKGLNKKEDENE